MPHFADVWIPSRAFLDADAYTYQVTETQHRELRPGAVVSVEFGSQVKIGYVGALHCTPPEVEAKSILEVLPETLWLGERECALCMALANRYACPPGLIAENLSVASDGLLPQRSYRLGQEKGMKQESKLSRNRWVSRSWEKLKAKLDKAGEATELSLKRSFPDLSATTLKLLLGEGWLMEETRWRPKSSIAKALSAPKLSGGYLKGWMEKGTRRLICLPSRMDRHHAGSQEVVAALKSGRQVLWIAPTHTAAQEAYQSLRGVGAQRRLALGQSLGQELRLKCELRGGETVAVIGARGSVLFPLSPGSLIVVDEEEDSAHKDSSYPYFHSREVAMIRAEVEGHNVVLLSGLPTVEAIYATGAAWDEVAKAEMPRVTLIDMRREVLASGSLISDGLEMAIEEALKAQGQVMLYHNRLGCAALRCREPGCGFMPRCPQDNGALHYMHTLQALRCPKCMTCYEVIASCPIHSSQLKYVSAGTERAHQELINKFPGCRILRLDSDVSSPDEAHPKLESFIQGKYQILLGTQMLLAKGTFYNVRTAAVLSAEAGLERRGYGAVHETLVNYQRFFAMAPFAENQLIQAHNPEHPALEYMLKGDAVSLLFHEHREREALGYPPFGYRIVFRAFSGLSVRRLTAAVSGLGIYMSVPSAGSRGSWEIEARIPLSQSPARVARQFFSALETSERRRAGVRVDP